ncbi:glycine zipper 2TM domain-containing protein [Caenimonas koreensis]|uniref:glycine zipper 2TM domain-containing protein n=1 Tax=Caenimonas koreensis TaxID=367474 RepID=UPI00378398FE
MKFTSISLATAALAAITLVAPLAAQAQGNDCNNCGTVQSVKAVQRNGGTNGIAGTQVTPGMAIGGVVGGLLGNQVGHGNGRAAATVVGVAGGAYAGHQIEKNRNHYTAYVMRIRMNDGSMRTIEQRTALARGSRVVVDGQSAHLRSTNPNANRG